MGLFIFLAWDHEYLIPSFLSSFHYSIIGRVTSFLFYLLELIKLFFRGSPGGARLDFRVLFPHFGQGTRTKGLNPPPSP